MCVRRRGFTLVELLVVIAIIGILIAVLLPAVQAAREAARRTTCVDNLKNLGLAALNYNSARRVLPPGKMVNSGNTEYSNWAIEILPFLEENVLYDRYDFKRPNYDNFNVKEVGQKILAVMGCPSDPNLRQIASPENADGRLFATGSYRAVGGRGYWGGGNERLWDSWKMERPGSAANWRMTDRGPMHVIMTETSGPALASTNAPTKWGLKQERLGKIADGTANTLLLGEYATTPERINRSVYWAYSYFGMNLGLIVDNVGSFFLVPDYDLCSRNMPDPGFPQACRRAFASYHAAGAVINFVMCDGAVRGIPTEVDLSVLANMATIDGGETRVLTQ